MRCIFCKQASDDSRSIEHILPESIGNIEHTLPPGVVCDPCNNYFAREVEKPFLDDEAIRLLRFYQGVPSKKGVIPTVSGLVLPNVPVTLYQPIEGPLQVQFPPLYFSTANSTGGTLLIPAKLPFPEGSIMSRFLAKAALEAFASRVIDDSAWREYLVDEIQFDPVRDHARRGAIRDWPYHSRELYAPDYAHSYDENGNPLQTIHEYDLLETEQAEWYFILALWGTEFALNIGGPEIDGYLDWLNAHDDESPLYIGKNRYK